jgi:hypothetical protein
MNEKTLTVPGISDFGQYKIECFSLVSLTQNQIYRNVDIMQLSFLQVGLVLAVQKKYLRPLDRNVFRFGLEDMS